MVTDRVGIRGTVNYGALGFDFQSDDLSYNADLEFAGASVLANIYPFVDRGFHLTTGLMFSERGFKGELDGSEDALFEINGHDYTAAEIGAMELEADLPGVQPYIGFGLWRPVRRGVNLVFMFDFGVAIGAARISMDATGARTNPALASDLKAEEDEAQDTLDRMPIFPVLSTALVYAF